MVRWRPRQAFEALYWYATRRRVRARNCLRRGFAATPHAYRYWIRHFEKADRSAAAVEQRCRAISYAPRFSIALYIEASLDPAQAAAAIRSVQSQVYPHWELLIVGGPGADIAHVYAEQPNIHVVPGCAETDASAIALAVAAASGEFIIPLAGNAQLPPAALLHYVEALQSGKSPSLLYGDDDCIDSAGKRRDPWFKPGWDADLVLAQDYVSAAMAVRTRAAAAVMPLRNVPAGIAPYALALAISQDPATAGTFQPMHVPRICCHLAARDADRTQASRARLVASYLERQGAATAIGQFGSVAISWPMPEPPRLVTIIIPTRDSVDILSACVASVLEKTRYAAFDILIVDNGSQDRATFEYFEHISGDSRISVLEFPGAFNYSAINNFAARHAAGDFLCLLNNDVEVLAPDWLGEMMRQAARPDTGAVGAKLLYPDGTIQHAGIVLGMGGAAGHAHRHLPAGDAGYFAQAHIARGASAVTAACLLVEKRKFLAVGGLDEVQFRVAYNDVDFCLKLASRGWRNRYVPAATLVHYESKSRTSDFSADQFERYRAELQALQRLWSTETVIDALHHPSLDRSSETYRLGL